MNTRTIALPLPLLLLVCAIGACGETSPGRVELTATALDFGYSVVGSRLKLSIDVANRSGQQETLTLRIEGAHAADFSATSQVTLPAGTSQSIEVVFAATDSGARTATLLYATSAESGAVGLWGFATRPEPSVPPSLDFGAALAGETRTLRISSVGPAVADTTADNLLFARQQADSSWLAAPPEFTGEGADQFSVEWPPAGFDPATGIAPGEALEVRVRLLPSKAGRRTATLVLSTNAPAQPRVEVAVTADAANGVPCRWSLSPSYLWFRTPVGATETQNLRIRQLDPDACEITDLALSPQSSSAYQLGAGPALAIPGRGEVEFPVTFRPLSVAKAEGSVTVRSGQAIASISLVGEPGAAIAFEPPTVSFGPLPCFGKERVTTLFNASTEPVRIDSFELSGSSDFTVTQRPALPRTMAPGERLTWALTYSAVDVGEDAATLTVRGPMHSTTLGVRGSRIDNAQTDVFQMEPPRAVDMLFVVDDSPSMADKQQSLATNLAAYFRFVDLQRLNYHLAVTTTAVDAAHGGSGTGADFANGRFVPLAGTGPRVIAPTTPDKAQAFATNANVGAASASDGFLMRPMELALSEPLLSTHNAGFLRPGAELAVVLITDGADHDPRQVSAFEYFLISLKGARNMNMISFNAILPTLAQAPTGCTYGEADAGLSTRVKELVTRWGGVYDEICTPDWHRTLEKLGRILFGMRTRFFLSNKPDMTIPDPIQVKIDGQPYAQYGAYGDKRWSYNSTAIAIDFEPLAVPDPGSTVTVTYQVACP